MSEAKLAKAEVVINGETIAVQFNPVSLQVEITNSINQQGEAGGTNQVSTQSSAKLGLDLLFDTSALGEDVRNKTRPLRAAVRAPQDAKSGGAGSGDSDAGAAFVSPGSSSTAPWARRRSRRAGYSTSCTRQPFCAASAAATPAPCPMTIHAPSMRSEEIPTCVHESATGTRRLSHCWGSGSTAR